MSSIVAGLPPSPPALPSSGVSGYDLPYPTNDKNGRTIKPLGVDVPRVRKNGIGKNMITVIVLSSVTAFVVCIGVIWILWLKYGCCTYRPVQTPHVLISSQGKTSGTEPWQKHESHDLAFLLYLLFE